MTKVKVLIEFADRQDFLKRYKVGDEVSFKDEAYVSMLVSRGIVEAPGFGVVSEIDLSKQWNNVVASVKAFTDVVKLKMYLAEENAANKPRNTVVKAIEARIAELEAVG